MPRPKKKFNDHPFPYHHELEVGIDGLTNEGSGVARVEGWVVFVPFVLPGERVRCRVFRNHKNYSEADLVEVLDAAPERVEPQCPLFGRCGGCQYQHVSYATQLEWKGRQLADLLKRLAGIEFPVEPVHASPQQWGYRSKITPHFHRPRDGQITEIGFLQAGTRNRLVDVEACPIAMAELNAALVEVRQEVRQDGGRWKNGATLLLRASEGTVVRDPKGLAVERVGPRRFEFQAGDFFQNNPFILPAFVEHVTTEARSFGVPTLVDAYCGSGLFGICAAEAFAEVVGVEVSETAVEKARHNAAINGLDHCRFLAASAEAIFEEVDRSGAETVVVIDPPRAGCSEAFLRQLVEFAPVGLVYVSCKPATQMRDLKILTEGGYVLQKVRPFDLFPQTQHLECVMTLARAAP
ncbi:MAG: class I SAM-dependent RNA methyltransferase [Verrucomicrobiales bacterium]|nr:class I SAM-dependent RNA methyltransferase [Verrucomicrobiales bacterium]